MDESNFDFIETAQYSTDEASSTVPLPDGWDRFMHPNGDHYFYNPEWRLLTPDNILKEDILGYITDAREEYLQELQDDPASGQLPHDYEVDISNVSASTASIRMYSRSAGAAYTWTEETGLEIKPREEFWTYVSEYPSHHPDLPPNTEAEFVLALNNAKITIANGSIFPFSEAQIDRIFARYSQLITQRSERQNITAQLAWLMGVTMPLDAVGRLVDGEVLAAMMNGLHF